MVEKTAYTSYDDYPVYDGEDLGLTYTPDHAAFKIWSPVASEVTLRLYEEGLGGNPLESISMGKDDQGTWTAEVEGDQKGRFYTFQAKIEGEWMAEVPDPYAKAVGVNGRRGMVVDLSEMNPKGWTEDQSPPLENYNDIIIYELHVRDASIHPESGIRHKGKYLGLTESGTTTPEGAATGLDHLVELGVTHVHLLPVFDFRSIDETKLEDGAYNWGYDPQNYNAPEGSYATDPYDGAVRIREFKQMVQAFHEAGIRVIMDVVYNHTGDTDGSNFNQLVPGYYYRHWEDGSFSDAAACGNETASERPMMRKFMIESLQHWVREYHIDGFRFDLMAIHDIETMNAISEVLHEMDPSIFLYGEGWTAGDSPLPVERRALKRHTHRLDRIAAFSDDIRDAVKGHVFTHDDAGFASGKPGLKESIKFGIVASTRHPQVDYDSINYSEAPWAAEPFQTITYVSAHDNHTLWDRLEISRPQAGKAERIRMQKLAGAIVLTSQGVSFLHAGAELLRTKHEVENSYQSPDSINRIDWTRKTQYPDVFDFYRSLIRMRKNHPAFRMTSTDQIQQHLRFLETDDDLLVAYTISGNANGDAWEDILVVLNGHRSELSLNLPEGKWTVVLDGATVDESGITGVEDRVTVPASSAMVFVKGGME